MSSNHLIITSTSPLKLVSSSSSTSPTTSPTTLIIPLLNTIRKISSPLPQQQQSVSSLPASPNHHVTTDEDKEEEDIHDTTYIESSRSTPQKQSTTIASNSHHQTPQPRKSSDTMRAHTFTTGLGIALDETIITVISSSSSQSSRSTSSDFKFNSNVIDSLPLQEEETDDDDNGDEEGDAEEEDQEEDTVVVERSRVCDRSGMSLAGLSVPIVTTHLLLSDTLTPQLVPSLLDLVLPMLSSRILVLNLSNCHLSNVPVCLSHLPHLSELSLSHNPLGVLPSTLITLPSLSVLLMDYCELASLSSPILGGGGLAGLDRLRVLSVRGNRLRSLPSWLCRCRSLEELWVQEGEEWWNGDWRGLVQGISREYHHHQDNTNVEWGASAVASMSGATSPLMMMMGGDRDEEEEGRRRGEERIRSVSTTSTTSTLSTTSCTSVASSSTQPSFDASIPTQYYDVGGKESAGVSGMIPPPMILLHSRSMDSSPVASSSSSFAISPEMMDGRGANGVKKEKRSKWSTLFKSSSSANSSPLLGSTSKSKSKSLKRPGVFRTASEPTVSTPATTTSSKYPGLKKRSSYLMLQSFSSPTSPPLVISSSTSSPSPLAPSASTTSTWSTHDTPTTITAAMRYATSLRSLMAYLKDLDDLSVDVPVGVSPVLRTSSTFPSSTASSLRNSSSAATTAAGGIGGEGGLSSYYSTTSEGSTSSSRRTSSAPPTPSFPSGTSYSSTATTITATTTTTTTITSPLLPSLKLRHDPTKSLNVIAEIIETEKSYVRGLQELCDLYVVPAELPYSVSLSTTPSMNSSGFVGLGSTGMSASSSSSLASTPTITSAAVVVGGGGVGGVGRSLSGKSTKKEKKAVASAVAAAAAAMAKREQEEEKENIRTILLRESPMLREEGMEKEEEVVPRLEREGVFGNVNAIREFHQMIFLPELLLAATSRKESETESTVAEEIAKVFIRHAVDLKMYSTYVIGFDSALLRIQNWSPSPFLPSSSSSNPTTPTEPSDYANRTRERANSYITMSGANGSALSALQKRRITAFLNRARSSPRHAQISLDAYLLLPVQRVPRYRMLLESLLACTPTLTPLVSPPPSPSPPTCMSSSEVTMKPLPPLHHLMPNGVIQEAAELIKGVAVYMNEKKRESEGRIQLGVWQERIGNKFRSPLVQAHRTLLREGNFSLLRVVKRSTTLVPDSLGLLEVTPRMIEVQSLVTERDEQNLIALLCTDIIVFLKDPTPLHSVSVPNTPLEGYPSSTLLPTMMNKSASSTFSLPNRPTVGSSELFTVLRLTGNNLGGGGEVASLVGGDNIVRIACDSRAILYVRCTSRSDARAWVSAINEQSFINS